VRLVNNGKGGSDTMICPKCGNVLNPNEQFCGNCGNKIENNINIKNDLQKNKINNGIKIATVALVLLIILSAVVIGVVILKGNKKENIFNSKYTINISYDEKSKVNLDDGISKTYYYPDSSSFAGQEKIVDVFKINNYVSVFESNSLISNSLEFSLYNEEKDKEHKLDSFGYLSDNIDKMSVLTTSEKRVYKMDYDYDEEKIKEALKNAPTIHQIAVDYSKDEDNIYYADKEPIIKKVNNNISRVDITQSWGQVDYNYFINFDGNEYYKITVSCNPVIGCNNESDELKEVLKTFEKIEFNVKNKE